MPPQKRFQDLLFVDVETTGLDPAKHELLEVAAVRTSPDGQRIVGSYEAKLSPLNIAGAEPKALEINGYNDKDWAPDKCTDPGIVADSLQKLANGTVLVGQNVSFDEGFLKPLFTKLGMKAPWGYHKVDTVALAWPLFINTPLEGLSLGKLCTFLNVETVPTHRAMADVLACREVYIRLMAKWSAACK